jgi:hypothetical protein
VNVGGLRGERAERAREAFALIRDSPSRAVLMTGGGGSWWNSGPCIGGEDARRADGAQAPDSGDDEPGDGP